MITIMSTDVSIPGRVITPDHVSEAPSFPAHDFFNVIRHLVQNSGAYHSEADQLAALEAVHAHEYHVVAPSDRNVVQSESDTAKIEDVTKRVPANAQPVTVSASPAIDYDALARALVKAQAAQSQPPQNEAPQTEVSPE